MALGLTGFTQLMSGAGSDKDIWGSKPIVPEFPSYTDALKEITKGNIGALPQLRKLGVKSTKAYSEMMEAAYPGITELKTLGTENIRNMLSGELPQSVQDILRTRSAEYGVGSGVGRSEFAGSKGLRDLGIAQLQYTQQGLDNASRWIAQAQGQTFDFSKMFLGPQDAIRQAEGRFSRDWLANQIKAAPDPVAKGIMDTEMQWIGMILSIYGGGSGYKPQPSQQPGGGGGGGLPGEASEGGQSYFSTPQGFYDLGSSGSYGDYGPVNAPSGGNEYKPKLTDFY